MNRRSADTVWSIVEERIDPDFAFVQEARQPTHLPEERIIWKAIGDNSRYRKRGRYYWATGIYSKNAPLRQVLAGQLGDGWVVVADAQTPEGGLTLVSIHVEPRVKGRYTDTLSWILTELSPVLEEEGRQIVLGGDLNVDPFFDRRRRTPRNQLALEEIASFGLFHCNTLLPAGARTYLRHEHPIQDDHLFVSEGLASRVACRVFENIDIDHISDHYPLIIDIRDAEGS